MFATATLVAHRGAQLVSRAALATVEPPAATRSWKPVKHALIVDLMHEKLDRRQIRITRLCCKNCRGADTRGHAA